MLFAVKRVAWLVAVVAACGDNISGPETGFPSAPQVQKGSGAVLAAPQITPIFFAGDDAMQMQVEQFLTALAPSSYWTAIASEYGIAAPTVLPSIVLTSTPPTTDADLQALLESMFGHPLHAPLAAAPVGLPYPNANSLYAVFLPAGVTLTAGSEVGCVDFGAYHDETILSHIVYAAMPRCQTRGAPIDGLTPALSHELIEASTDPHPETAPGYLGVDDEDFVWNFTPGPEVGDMCEYVGAAYERLVDGFVVQRSWSNASAAAGHDPCVPALVPYVTTAPLLFDVTFGEGSNAIQTRGVEIPNGESREITLALRSDAPASDWTIAAEDVASAITHMPAELSLGLERNAGNNGDTIKLTIKRLKDGDGGGSEFVISTRVDNKSVALWWGLATN
jgi:hypothetical protein